MFKENIVEGKMRLYAGQLRLRLFFELMGQILGLLDNFTGSELGIGWHDHSSRYRECRFNIGSKAPLEHARHLSTSASGRQSGGTHGTLG